MDDDNDEYFTPTNSYLNSNIQNIKNYSIAFKDTLTLPQIRKVYKLSESTLLNDKEIDNIIKNVLTSSKQVKLSAFDNQILIDKLSTSMPMFDKALWTESDVLGEGTYGKVCKLEKGSEKIAYKTFKMGIQQDTIREIGSYALLSSTNTKYSPKIHGMTFEPDISIALELATGSLWDYALKLSYTRRIQVFPEVFDMAIKCLSEFQSCNLVHGDIKTQNMLAWWDPKGTSPTFRQLCKLRLTDFGLTSSRPDFGDNVYTPGFRAPELYVDTNLKANKETDVYAMGKTLIDFLFKNTYISPPDYLPQKIPDDIVEKLKKIPHGDEVLAMVSKNPDDRPRMDIHIFTFPKRKWGFIRKDAFDGIIQDAWKRCQNNGLSNATFVQTIDLILRCTYIDRDRFTSLNYEPTACLMLASYWGEYEPPTFPKYMDKLRDDMKQILEMVNGLVYEPGLEYMQNYSLEQMVNEFESKMIR